MRLSLWSRFFSDVPMLWIFQFNISTINIIHRHVFGTAGKNMTEHYHSKGTADENIEGLGISTKSCQSDFATAIDVMNENFISGEIKKAFPDHEVRKVSSLCLMQSIFNIDTWFHLDYFELNGMNGLYLR